MQRASSSLGIGATLRDRGKLRARDACQKHSQPAARFQQKPGVKSSSTPSCWIPAFVGLGWTHNTTPSRSCQPHEALYRVPLTPVQWKPRLPASSALIFGDTSQVPSPWEGTSLIEMDILNFLWVFNVSQSRSGTT